MSDRAHKILDSINLDDKPTKLTVATAKHLKSWRPSHKFLNSRDKSLDTNPTIKYFRSFSSRRLRPLHSSPKRSPGSAFAPYSRDALLERIATYQKLTHWDEPHPRLSAVVCAAHGWNCDPTSKNQLRCVSCAATFAIRLPVIDDDEDGIMMEKIVDKYVEMLISAHKENCPWKKQHTPKSVYDITVGNLPVITKEFKENYVKNLEKKSVLEGMRVVAHLTAAETETIRVWLEKNRLEYNEKAVLLSVSGWVVQDYSGMMMLTSSSDARRVLISTNPIDLLEEHQPWSCYYTGYKTLIECLKLQRAVSNRQDEAPQTPTADVPTKEDTGDSNTRYEETVYRLEKMKKLYLDM